MMVYTDLIADNAHPAPGGRVEKLVVPVPIDMVGRGHMATEHASQIEGRPLLDIH